MTNFRTYCDDFYARTGLKFHWYLKSCCLDISSFNETSNFNDFKSSSTLNDADIIVIGTKIGNNDIAKMKNVLGFENKKIILFGNCAFDGGIFSRGQNHIRTLGLNAQNVLFVPGCPPSLSQFTTFFENFFKAQI